MGRIATWAFAGVGKLAAWFVLDPVVPDSNKKNVKQQKYRALKKSKNVEDCLKNTAGPSLDTLMI